MKWKMETVVFFALVLLCAAVQIASGDQVGMSAKWKNLTNRKLKLYWINHDNEPYFNSYVRSGEAASFATYEGHRFFWGEVDGPEEPSDAPGINPIAPFPIEKDKFVYIVTDDTSDPKLIRAHEEEMHFLENYEKKTGRAWISEYPRHPPIHEFLPAPEVDYTSTVEIEGKERKWICGDAEDPKCRGEKETLTIRVVTTEPRSFEVENFMSDFECDFIVDYHRPRMSRSQTGFGENAKIEKVRTSKSDRMSRHQHLVSDAIYRRMAKVFKLKEEIMHGDDSVNVAEPVNIVQYGYDQEYTPHFDAGPSDHAENHRFLSAILYFNTPTAGGTTSFPKAVDPETGEEGVHVKAVKGNMMFFYDLLEDGNMDAYSLHAGEKVKGGEKWIGAAWFWDPCIDSWKVDEAREKHEAVKRISLFDRVSGKPLPLESKDEL